MNEMDVTELKALAFDIRNEFEKQRQNYEVVMKQIQKMLGVEQTTENAEEPTTEERKKRK